MELFKKSAPTVVAGPVATLSGQRTRPCLMTRMLTAPMASIIANAMNKFLSQMGRETNSCRADLIIKHS